jgi:hypothetical protein
VSNVNINCISVISEDIHSTWSEKEQFRLRRRNEDGRERKEDVRGRKEDVRGPASR